MFPLCHYGHGACRLMMIYNTVQYASDMDVD